MRPCNVRGFATARSPKPISAAGAVPRASGCSTRNPERPPADGSDLHARVARISKREALGIASQTAALVDWAATLDLEVPQQWIFEDDGYSGATLERPGLEQVRDLAAARHPAGARAQSGSAAVGSRRTRSTDRKLRQSRGRRPALEVIRIERLIPRYLPAPGRPPKDRAAMARAFVAKAVYDLPSTRALLDRLAADVVLRRVCGWERKGEVPSESVFSRAFAEFADTQLPQRVHETLIRETHHDRLVGHLSRDSTAIEAREKPATKETPPPPPKRKRGRPKKGEERPKVLTRLERQPTMNLAGDAGRSADRLRCRHEEEQQGLQVPTTWVGYKLHIDVADGQIPISCLLTSASLHDSQAAIPLATLSAERTTNLYDLMDAAYDAEQIREHSRSLGHVPLIDVNPRGDKARAEELRTEARRLKNLGFQRRRAGSLQRAYGG